MPLSDARPTATRSSEPRFPKGVPNTKARSQAEKEFLALGDGAQSWLIEASAAGTSRIRAKMVDAVELAALVGADDVDEALGIAAAAGRFADGDVAAIVRHLATGATGADLVIADEAHSAQPGTGAWAGFGTRKDTGR
jgi:hypothetical protein